MKSGLVLASLLLAYASTAATYPALPVYDPFTDATARGGTSYAPGSPLAGQTNGMGQNWYGINTGAGVGTAITNTGSSVSYNNLPGFSGQQVLMRNVNGMGTRLFFANSTPLSPGANSYYYSAIITASNINSLSPTFGQRIFGFGTQTSLGDQSSQPSQGSTLWMKQVGTSPNFGFQLGLTGSGNPGTPTFDSANTYNPSQSYFLVVAVESGDVPNLWINPDPSTFGASTEPAATYTAPAGTLKLSSFTCAQMFEASNAAPDALYVSVFRLGTNWSWVTGGPAIGLQPVASTNCASGVLNLTATAMDNGTPNGYRWQFNGVNLTDGPSPSGSGAIVSGAGTASLTITGMDTGAAQRDSGSYTVVVTNAYGSVASSAAVVTAHAAPSITQQPTPSVLRVYPGSSPTLTLSAVGFAPLYYYWYSNSVVVSATTNSSLAVANVQANGSFYCVVSNSIGTVPSSTVSITVVSAPTAPYPVSVLHDHPMSYWPLNEVPDNGAGNNGTATYDYAGGNNGYYTNVYLGQAGYGPGLATQYGYSPQTDTSPSVGFGSFSGYDSYVAQIPNIDFAGSQASSFSVEAWANGNNSAEANGAGIVNKGYGGGGEQFTLDYANAGWRFFVRSAAGTLVTAASTSTIDANWHHLVGVVNAAQSNITLYVDGVAAAAASFNPSAGLLSSANPVVIGSRTTAQTSSDFTDNFYGNIQDVAIYNYALSAAQVANHYYAAGVGPSVAVPASTNVDEGTTLVVPASAAGSTPLACQWYDVTSGSPGTALTGQTNAMLVISNISAAAYNNHYLSLTVTNLYGQATSGLLVLQVASGAPTSVVISPAAQAVYAGSSLPVPFTVTAQGTHPFSYQWFTNGVAVPGATSASFSTVPPRPGTYTVGCQLGNSYGTSPMATASLRVAAVPTDFYGTTVLRAGPVAFWRLDEAPGAVTAYDYVGGHNATYSNAVNGQVGFSPATLPAETSTLFGDGGTTPSLALESDNTASGLPLIDFASQGANAEFTLEAWVQVATQTGNRNVLAKGYPNNTQFGLDTGGSGGAFRFVVHNQAGTLYSVSSGAVLPDGQWHHLVGVCDQANGTLRMYADGSLRASSGIASGSGVLSLPSTYPVTIAGQENQGGSAFTCMSNACISQVAIYAYALPASQVVSNYYAATYVAPTISAAVSGANLVLTYTGTLVSSASAAGPFTNVVTGAASPFTVPLTNVQTFFRARSIP